MKIVRIMVTALIVVIGMISAARFVAQSTVSAPVWETLVRTPMPTDVDPVISVNGLTMPAEPVAEHSHPGQTIAYIVAGEIENQVAPDPPAIHKPGSHFYEAPRQLHKMMRNLSAEPAKLFVAAGGGRSPLTKRTRIVTLLSIIYGKTAETCQRRSGDAGSAHSLPAG